MRRHTSFVRVFYPCNTASENALQSLRSNMTLQRIYLALYEEQQDQETQTSETHAHVHIHRHTPPVLFYCHGLVSLHMLRLTSRFLWLLQ